MPLPPLVGTRCLRQKAQRVSARCGRYAQNSLCRMAVAVGSDCLQGRTPTKIGVAVLRHLNEIWNNPSDAVAIIPFQSCRSGASLNQYPVAGGMIDH